MEDLVKTRITQTQEVGENNSCNNNNNKGPEPLQGGI